MRLELRRRGILVASVLASIGFAVACNALTGASDLGVCDPGDLTCPEVAAGAEAGAADALVMVDASPATDGAIDAAAPDSGVPAFGTGRSGPLAVPAGPPMIVNAYAALTGAVAAGDTALSVADAAAFAPGDLVLVWQTSGLGGVVSGAQSPITLGSSSVGHFEIVRVASTAGARLVLATPLASSYPVPGTQVVTLPEYTDVKVPMGSAITASAWDGMRGGIVAFLATGMVDVEGDISVDALGFRGGLGYQDTAGSGCAALDGDPAAGYAAKGEGIALAGYTTATDGGGVGGRGNRANGAGGGNCHNGGGAGGGHGGSGGAGGMGMNGNALGGLGGATLLYAPDHALLMGGGGAAGDDNNGAPLPSGGAGGGAIFLRARIVGGNGAISARGANGTQAPANDGCGGGGAGGGIVVVAGTSLKSVVLRAEGGPGGNGSSGAGGGGGGGGVIDVSTSAFQSSAAVSGGAGGGLGLLQSAAGANGRFGLGDGG